MKTSSHSAGTLSPVPAVPVQIMVSGEKLMIRCKGVQIVISFQGADPEEPPCRCVGCGCPVIVQPSNAKQQ